MQFDWSAIWPAIPLLIEGAKMTLWISVLGLAGGLVIGLAAGFARTFGGWIANHVALVFIEVIRGTPIVVQVMFIYFALPMAFNDLRIDPFSAAVVTIMINSGAYIAEITRGAVLSIHKGFSEAGLALGLSRTETIRHVILPLALRRMLPPLVTSGSSALKILHCSLLSAWLNSPVRARRSLPVTSEHWKSGAPLRCST